MSQSVEQEIEEINSKMKALGAKINDRGKFSYYINEKN